MNSLAHYALLLGVIFSPLFCASAEKINVPELLNPDTRMRAFQEFMLQRHKDLEALSWEDLETFSKSHQDLQVQQTLDPRTFRRRLVVTHGSSFGSSTDSDDGAYPTENFARLFPPVGAASAIYPSSVQVYAFDEHGSFIHSPDNPPWVADGFVQDLTSGGRIEVLAQSSRGSTHYLTVTELSEKTPFFAVAYGFNRAANEPEWSCAIQRSRRNGSFDILLGPKHLGEILPQVTLEWNSAKRSWTPSEDSNRVRMLDPKKLFEELADYSDSRPAAQSAADPRSDISITKTAPDIRFGSGSDEEISPEEASKPYRYTSLAALSHPELLHYMGRGRNITNIRNEMAPAVLPPDFWSSQPKTAALRFVERNRPAESLPNSRLAIDDLDGKAPPEEGSLTVSDGPSGCFSPSGAFEYYLHCSKQESYWVVIRRLSHWHRINPLLVNPSDLDIRKIKLTHEESRRILQVVWWLDRVRSKRVGDSYSSAAGWSTADGFASIVLKAGGESVMFQGKRFWTSLVERPLPVSEFSGDYTRTAWLNMVVWLAAQGMPAYLGDRWSESNHPEDQPAFLVRSLRTDYSPQQLARLGTSVRDLLQLAVTGKVSPQITRELVIAARNLALREVRPELKEIAASLPEPSARERRLGEISEAIKDWRNRLGPEGTDWHDSFERRYPQGAIPAIPGIDPVLDRPKSSDPAIEEKVPDSPPSDLKFAELDALYAEESRLRDEQPLDEKAISDLRDELTATSRWFEIYEGPEQLYELATGGGDYLFDACRRLRELNPDKAVAAIRNLADQQESATERQLFLEAIDEIHLSRSAADPEEMAAERVRRRILRLTGLPSDATALDQANGLMALAADGKRRIDERMDAIQLLVPMRAPRKFLHPEIEEFLIQLTQSAEQHATYLLADVCRALALRGGGKHWELIASLAKTSSGIGMPRFPDLLPALATIAMKEPDYRAQLRELIAPHFKKTHGSLNALFWIAWLTDQRELKSAIEELATSSPADAEGILGRTHSNHPSAVKHRFHAARHAAALWNEKDGATRAKLLIAAKLAQPEVFAEEAFTERLRKLLTVEAAKLSNQEREAMMSFVEWCASRRPSEPLEHEETSAQQWLAESRAILSR